MFDPRRGGTPSAWGRTVAGASVGALGRHVGDEAEESCDARRHDSQGARGQVRAAL